MMALKVFLYVKVFLQAFVHSMHTGQAVNPCFPVAQGINPYHVEFSGRAFIEMDLVDDGRNGFDDCEGHGTHVSGTIAGATVGIAKRATIHMRE